MNAKSSLFKKATYKDIMLFGFSEGHSRRLLTTIKASFQVKTLLLYHLYKYFDVPMVA